jgi:hypothetical protein
MITLYASCKGAYGVCNSGHTMYLTLARRIRKLYSQSPSQPLKATSYETLAIRRIEDLIHSPSISRFEGIQCI